MHRGRRVAVFGDAFVAGVKGGEVADVSSEGSRGRGAREPRRGDVADGVGSYRGQGQGQTLASFPGGAPSAGGDAIVHDFRVLLYRPVGPLLLLHLLLHLRLLLLLLLQLLLLLLPKLLLLLQLRGCFANGSAGLHGHHRQHIRSKRHHAAVLPVIKAPHQ